MGSWTSLVTQTVKCLAYNAGDLGSVPGLGRSSGEGKAPHSSTLAWKIPQTEEHVGLQSTGLQRVRHDLVTEQQQRDKNSFKSGY